MNITDEVAETDPALIPPAIARACSRCHDRKVKVCFPPLTEDGNSINNRSATFKYLNVVLVNVNG